MNDSVPSPVEKTYLLTQTSCSVSDADFVIQAQLTLLQGEVAEMQVDQLAFGHLDGPLAACFVVVVARETHRGHGAVGANQVFWSSTARCYMGRTEGETQ